MFRLRFYAQIAVSSANLIPVSSIKYLYKNKISFLVPNLFRRQAISSNLPLCILQDLFTDQAIFSLNFFFKMR